MEKPGEVFRNTCGASRRNGVAAFSRTTEEDGLLFFCFFLSSNLVAAKLKALACTLPEVSAWAQSCMEGVNETMT